MNRFHIPDNSEYIIRRMVKALKLKVDLYFVKNGKAYFSGENGTSRLLLPKRMRPNSIGEKNQNLVGQWNLMCVIPN